MKTERSGQGPTCAPGRPDCAKKNCPMPQLRHRAGRGFGCSLEAIFQTKLQNAPGNRARRDQSKVGAARQAVARFIELCVIPKVEEFRAELEGGAFTNPSDDRVLDDRSVKIELRAAARDSDAGIAEACAASDELRIGTACRPGARAVATAPGSDSAKQREQR